MDVDMLMLKGLTLGVSIGFMFGWLLCWLNFRSSNSNHNKE